MQLELDAIVASSYPTVITVSYSYAFSNHQIVRPQFVMWCRVSIPLPSQLSNGSYPQFARWLRWPCFGYMVKSIKAGAKIYDGINGYNLP